MDILKPAAGGIYHIKLIPVTEGWEGSLTSIDNHLFISAFL